MKYNTAAEALNELNNRIANLDWKNSIKDRELIKLAILDVVSKTSVHVDHAESKITVLYSGDVNGKKSFDIAADMASNSDIRILDKTSAFELLKSQDFQNIQAKAFGYQDYDAMDTHLKSIHGDSPSIYDTPEKKFEGDGKSGLWAIISRNFAAETVGEVRIVTVYPREDSVLAATEIETLLKEQKVTKIDGSTLDEIMASGNPKSYIIANAAYRTILSNPSEKEYAYWLKMADDKVYQQALDNSDAATRQRIRDAHREITEKFGRPVSEG